MTFRSLARASAIYTVGNFIPRIGAFLLLPVYVRFLSTEQYGTVSLITSLAGLLAILFTLGQDAALMRLHFDERGDRQRALYSTLTAFVILMAVFGSALAAAVLFPVFSTLFAGLAFVPYGVLGIGIAALSAADFAPAVFYRATAQAGKFLAFSIGAFGAASVASVTLVVLGFGAPGMLIGQLVGAGVSFLVAIFLVVRIAGLRFQRTLVRPAVRFGAPLAPHAVSGWALRLADRWLIGLLIGLPAAQALGQLGAYSLGYQLGYVITVLVSSFNTAWSPWFFRIGNTSQAPALFSKMTTLVMAGLAAVGVAVAVLAPQIVAVIARPQYAAAADVLPIIAMASVLYGMYTMLSVVVFYAKATARLAMITVSAGVLNVVVNVVLIPPFGILGAAWATFAAYAWFAGATWWFSRTVYPVRLEVRRLAVLAVAGAAALGLASLTSATGSDLGAAGLRVLIALGFAVVAGLVGLESARSLLRSARPTIAAE